MAANVICVFLFFYIFIIKNGLANCCILCLDSIIDFKYSFALNDNNAKEWLIMLCTNRYIRVSIYYTTVLDPSIAQDHHCHIIGIKRGHVVSIWKQSM